MIEDDPLYPLFKTMSYTGMRRGEACGLRWCDLHPDADPPYLLVTQQITLGPRGTFEDSPDDFVFAAWGHRKRAWLAPPPNAVAGRFKRLVRRAGVTPITIQGLRHTRATLMVADGVPDRVVADQLGHRDTRFTASV